MNHALQNIRMFLNSVVQRIIVKSQFSTEIQPHYTLYIFDQTLFIIYSSDFNIPVHETVMFVLQYIFPILAAFLIL